MTLFSPIKNMFSKKKPELAVPEGDSSTLVGTQAERLAAATRAAERTQKNETPSGPRTNGAPHRLSTESSDANGPVSLAPKAAAADGPMIETKPMPTKDAGKAPEKDAEAKSGKLLRKGDSKSVAELQKGYQEVIGLVSKISDHLDRQAARTDRLVELMGEMPEALGALPEINRQNARLLDVISDHLEHSRSREDAFNNALARISEATSSHADVLGLVQQQLENNTQTSAQLTKSIDTFQGAVSELAKSNRDTRERTAELMKQNADRETMLVNAFTKSHRWMIAAVICCGGACLAGAAIAGVVLVTQMAG